MSLVITIKTENGEYQLWKPKGQTGVKHMIYFMKFSKIAKDAEETGMDIIDDERLYEVFEEWCNKVLPNIIIKTPFESYEDIPFDDMFFIFMKVMSSMSKIDEESFRHEESQGT